MNIRIVISSGHDWEDRSGLGGQASNPDRGRFFLHSRLTPLLSVQFHQGPFAVPDFGSLALEGWRQSSGKPPALNSVSLLKIDLDPIEPGWPWVGPVKKSDLYRYFQQVSVEDHPPNGAIRLFGNRNRAECLSRNS